MGTEISRIYKNKGNRTEKTFNYKGAFGRFDHHINPTGTKSQRGTSYWGFTLSCCLVEVFGDQKYITKSDRALRKVGLLTLSEPLLLLDLCGSGAMRVGTTTKIAKNSARKDTQTWSRYFYNNPQTFKKVDGLIYANSHNDEVAICLYERANPKIAGATSFSIDLNNTGLQSAIQQICLDNGMKYL